MTKVKVRNTEKFGFFLKRRIKRIAREAMADPRTGKKIRGVVIRGIKQDEKLPSDRSVPDFANRSYVKTRKRIAQHNKTDRFFQAETSNMTITGRFLRSFKIVIIKSKNVFYSLGPTGKHRGYMNKNGTRGKTVNNEDIGKGMIANGRDWTTLGPNTKKEFNKIIATSIIRALRKRLKL